jgi:predicted P-loop ATPase
LAFQNVNSAARWWISNGFWPVPIPFRAKKPVSLGWTNLRIDETSVDEFFNGGKQNVGVLLGDRYGSADVDLDATEALSVAHAFLPHTGMIFGHQSKPASHWIYRCDPPVRTRQFKDPINKSMLVELRGRKKEDGEIGLQTVVPPSVHDSSGEPIVFQSGYDTVPANVDAALLVDAVSRVAAAALLARYWPAHGRHDGMLALAGILARGKWLIDDSLNFCSVMYRAVPTHDPSAVSRCDSEVRDTYGKVASETPTTGFPTLTGLIDSKVVTTALGWLGLSLDVREKSEADWRNDLVFTKDGSFKPVLLNAITMLRHAAEWQGVLAFNEFSLQTVVQKPAPWAQSDAGRNWSDDDDVRTAEWLQHNGIFVPSNIAAEAAQVIAKEHRFHPVRDYLKKLSWDGTPRIDTWLIDCFGAVDTTFTRAIGPRWMTSGAARACRPGCQVDHVLLVQGPQGLQKSSGLRTLVGDDWFSDHVSDLGSKDSRLELHGVWVLELGELDKIRGAAQIQRVKAFITARFDRFRPPYGRRAESVPRSCIFSASTNDETPLTDETGNRRFWPIRCGTINVPRIAEQRDQLWAEAYHRYQNGEPWWLDTAGLNEAAAEEQERNYEVGVWDDVILDWLDDPIQRMEKAGEKGEALPLTPYDSEKGKVTITDVLLHGIGKPLDRLTQSDRNQVQRCLVHHRWKRKQDRSRGPLRGKWFYERPEDES